MERKRNYKHRQYIVCLTDGEDSGSECEWINLKELLE